MSWMVLVISFNSVFSHLFGAFSYPLSSWMYLELLFWTHCLVHQLGCNFQEMMWMLTSGGDLLLVIHVVCGVLMRPRYLNLCWWWYFLAGYVMASLLTGYLSLYLLFLHLCQIMAQLCSSWCSLLGLFYADVCLEYKKWSHFSWDRCNFWVWSSRTDS